MSFGQKPSAAWSRPQGAPQQQINPNLFTNQLGLAATGQAFSGIHGMPALNSGFAGLVNQAAFTNTMNMQNMLAQAQRQHQIMPAQQQVPQQARHPQQQQQQATSPTRSQRAFIGKVTKMMETYGFVDEDVFFQTNVIRGAMPRAGDRVMVEANYNPSMPFKWNASRVQLVQEATQQQPPARQPSQQQQNGSGGGSRWAERTAAAAADEPSRRRSPFTSKRHRSRSPPRRSSPRRRESPKRERDLPTKREREAEKEKERAASSVRGHSAKRDTADSPPRRRQRVIPRYFCNLPKMLPPKGEFKCADLRRRYTNLYVPSDFIRADFDWVQSIQLEQPLNFSPYPIQFNVLHKDVDIPLAEGEQMPMPSENPADADYRYVVKVLLISHPGLSVIRQKISGLSVDGSIDEAVETQSLTKSIHLLVGHKSKGEYMCIGGPWSPALDGPNPMAPQTLIKTAIRTTKSLTGLDLSNCSKWYKMVHLRYFRVERQRIDSVVLMLPDTSTITEFKVTEESYRAAEQLLRDQLAAKLSALEAEEFIPPGQNAPADELNKNSNTESAVLPNNDGENTNTGGTAAAEDANQQETEVNQTSEENVETTNTQNIQTSVPEAMDTTSANTQQSESDEQQQSETVTAQSNASIFSTSSTQSTKKEVKTPWAKLEPIVRAMKVAELREELELRGLDSKGVKNILMQRLMDAIEKEKALDKENEGNNEAIQPQNEPNNGEEATEQSKEQQEGGGVEQVQPEQGNEQEQAEVPQQNAPEKQSGVVKEKESIMVKIKEEIIELMETDETTEEKKETPEEKEAREKAEKEQRELEKAKEKFEKGKKERKASLERHYAQIPKEPGIFVYPSKTAKSGKFDLKTMSLHSLLDYRLEDSKEASFEVFMFAEAIKEAFDRSNAFVVYHTISTALDKDEEKKRLNEALAEACKDEDIVCVDEGNGKKDAKDKEKDDKGGSGEKPKSPTNTVDLRSNFKALVNNFDMFTAFVHFDTNVCGYLNDRDVEEIIYSIGLDLSRAEVQRLIKRLSSKDRVNYRNLTDKWVDKEGECKYTPKPTYENLAQSYAEHAKGHFQLKMLDDNSEKEPQQMEVDESGIIFYKGTVVNVKHCLEQQMLMEQERQNVLDANNQLEIQLKASKDQCGQLEKKKRRLEDDVDRYKKKLHDTEKSLRKEQEDYSAAKKALQDCKRYGERINGIVEKILPPPKPKETSSEKEKDKNASKEKEKEALDGIVLIDEAVANPEKEDANEETAENAQEQQQSSKSQDEMDTNNATAGEDAVNGKQNEQEVEAQIGTENDEEKQQE